MGWKDTLGIPQEFFAATPMEMLERGDPKEHDYLGKKILEQPRMEDKDGDGYLVRNLLTDRNGKPTQLFIKLAESVIKGDCLSNGEEPTEANLNAKYTSSPQYRDDLATGIVTAVMKLIPALVNDQHLVDGYGWERDGEPNDKTTDKAKLRVPMRRVLDPNDPLFSYTAQQNLSGDLLGTFLEITKTMVHTQKKPWVLGVVPDAALSLIELYSDAIANTPTEQSIFTRELREGKREINDTKPKNGK